MFVKQIFEDFENLENKKESNLNKTCCCRPAVNSYNEKRTDLLVQLHCTSVVDPQKLIDGSHFGYVVWFPFLFLFEQKKVNRIVLRFCQFESLHYLKTSFSESRVATFGDVTIPALELSGLIWRSIIAGISIECFATVKTANVTDFSKNDRSQSVPHAGHRTKHFVLRHGLCYDPHLKIDLIGSFLRCGYEINTLILSHCG